MSTSHIFIEYVKQIVTKALQAAYCVAFLFFLFILFYFVQELKLRPRRSKEKKEGQELANIGLERQIEHKHYRQEWGLKVPFE